MQDKIDTLEEISQLSVSTYKNKNITYFVFGEPDKPFLSSVTNCKPLKTICTYPKAKLFAEGIALGRRLH